jgi:outer membrane protein TolC
MLLSRGSPAADGTQPGHELSLDQALTMARKANRNLVAERARLAQAQTNIETAWAALFPTLAAQGKYTRNNIEFKFALPSDTPGSQPQVFTIQPKNQLDGVINAVAPIIAPAAYPALEAVKASVHSAEANFEASLASVLFSVAQAYYAAAISDEVVAARASSIDVAQATLNNAQTRFASGAVTKVDVDRAELALVRAQQAMREAQFGRDQAYRAVATLIQSQHDFKVQAVGASPPLPAVNQQDLQSLDLALHLRPEFHAITWSVASAKAERRAYAWRWAPSVSAFANARAFNYDNFAQQRHAWAVGAQLDWVLFDGGVRDAQRHLADAQAREAEARAELLRDSIRDDLKNDQGLLETKRHAQEAAERSVALAVETLDLVRTQYEAGNTAQIDLLQAQDGLTSAKEALAQAHLEVAIADLTLRRAAGTFPGK